MKIKKLKLTNFAKFTDFECDFNGNVTRLVGVNGSGKTTVGLTAIWAGLKGISEKSGNDQLIGERFRFIGRDKATADVELTLIDEVKNAEIIVKNHISKQSNKITFEAPDGYHVDNEWVNNLLSVAFLSAKNFIQLNTRQQALELGIDTAKFENKLVYLKQEYTLINREIRAFGELQEVEKVVPVLTSILIEEKQKIDEFNREQDILKLTLDNAEDEKDNLYRQMDDLKKQMSDVKYDIEENSKLIIELPKPEPYKPDTVSEKLSQADEINAKAHQYRNYMDQKSKKDAKEVELKTNKIEQEKIEKSKIEYIKLFNFGFDGLSVADNGGLLLNGRPIKEPYFSKGELEIIVAKLYASRKPELKLRFIDDYELLDEDNQVKLVDRLLKEGFQIITAETGKVKVKDNTILLRECKSVDSYKPKNELTLL